MWPFKCEHPFWALQVEKEQTVVVAGEDFEHVDYHFRCAKCGEMLIKKHAKLIGGVSAFMERGMKSARVGHETWR